MAGSLRTVTIERRKEVLGVLHPDNELRDAQYIPIRDALNPKGAEDIPEELRKHILEEMQKRKVSGQWGEFTWRDETNPSDKRCTIG